jgi:hypothetical protein
MNKDKYLQVVLSSDYWLSLRRRKREKEVQPELYNLFLKMHFIPAVQAGSALFLVRETGQISSAGGRYKIQYTKSRTNTYMYNNMYIFTCVFLYTSRGLKYLLLVIMRYRIAQSV